MRRVLLVLLRAFVNVRRGKGYSNWREGYDDLAPVKKDWILRSSRRMTNLGLRDDDREAVRPRQGAHALCGRDQPGYLLMALRKHKMEGRP